MQNEKIWIIVLILINVAMIITCGYFYVTKDRVPPKISFSQNDIIYEDDIPQSELLKGVGAVDKVDGDISDRVVIEKILKNEDRGAVVVYYAACDYSGNVAKASREFAAKFAKPEHKQEATKEE